LSENPISLPTEDRQIWIDGRFVPWSQATVHLLSHSLQRGSLIFDYMSVHQTPRGPAVFRLSDHIARFLRSAELVGLPLELGGPAIEAAVAETVRRNPGSQAVKVSAYLPSIEIDVVPLDARVSVAIAAYRPFDDVIAHKSEAPVYSPTLSLWIEKARKNRRADIMPPQAKVAANYASPMLAKWQARKRGYDEILLIDEHGFVAEGPTTNVFWVNERGELLTPPADHVLLGVTRRTILEVAKDEGLVAHEAPVRPEELMQACEVFLTGTTAGVWPVASIDDHVVGDGQAGPVSLRLRDRFREIVDGKDPAFHHWLTFVSEA
jgi:branched-chain amino acid aminotransferase